MHTLSFKLNGKEHQAEKLTELETKSGQRRIQITTKDHRVFELMYVESLFRWVISDSYEKAVTHRRCRAPSKN